MAIPTVSVAIVTQRPHRSLWEALKSPKSQARAAGRWVSAMGKHYWIVGVLVGAAGGSWVSMEAGLLRRKGGRSNFQEWLVTFPASFPIDILQAKPAVEVASDNHMIAPYCDGRNFADLLYFWMVTEWMVVTRGLTNWTQTTIFYVQPKHWLFRSMLKLLNWKGAFLTHFHLAFHNSWKKTGENQNQVCLFCFKDFGCKLLRAFFQFAKLCGKFSSKQPLKSNSL